MSGGLGHSRLHHNERLGGPPVHITKLVFILILTHGQGNITLPQ